jgi:hypothetical protein
MSDLPPEADIEWATTWQRMLDISVPLFLHRTIERAFASAIVLRLVENPMEMPRFATSAG